MPRTTPSPNISQGLSSGLGMALYTLKHACSSFATQAPDIVIGDLEPKYKLSPEEFSLVER